jgi:2-iminobutanoate/2-iminopropanoate deaminase
MTFCQRVLVWILLIAVLSGCASGDVPMFKKVVTTVAAPAARGPYSQAIAYGNLLFVSGQLAIDPTDNRLLDYLDIEGQTRQVLENIKAILSANGIGMEHVLSTTVYLANVEDFKRMNHVYESYFSAPFPARATVGSAMVVPGALIEISAIAGK